MKHDEIEQLNPIVDLFYPDEESRDRLKRRRANLSSLPGGYINNLELEKVSDIICRHYQYRLVKMFEEMCDDLEVIKYRQDILEDFINIPKLAGTVQKIVNIMVENDRGNIYNLSEPDSFTTLSEAIRAFDAYVECMEIMHAFYTEHRSEIRSDGVNRLFGYFEDGYADKDFIRMKADLSELETALKNRIRSVTVAINLNENLVPVSAGIVDYSDRKYCLKPSLFDRILYRGAKFPEKTVKNLHRKYRNDDDLSADELLINTVDEALFKELDEFTKGYVKKLSDVMADYQRIGFQDIFSINYQLEFYMGAVQLIESAEAKGVKMCRPTVLPKEERRADIKGLFDLIYYNEAAIYNIRAKEDKKSVVTNDITFDENGGFYILTGANNGGKTTFVRGLGICQALAQMGLYVPAESCEISAVDFIYTHFPKEEELGINSSRFTTEIKEFKEISDTITNHSLLLMNESIQSTTPRECIDIAARLVKIFCRIGVRGIFATHLTDIAYKAKELNDSGELHTKIESIVVTVDEQTGERKYKIKKGMPTDTSYAAAVFDKFGIDEEDIEKRVAQMKY